MATVKNLNVNDLALISLQRGEDDAPRAVFRTLEAKGFVRFKDGRPTLTAKGKDRADALKNTEHDLRKMFAPVTSGNRCPITTAAGSGLRS